MTVEPNIYLSTKVSMIWATTAMGEKNYRNISSTQLDSRANTVVVGKQVCTIQRSRKRSKVREFSNKCSKIEKFHIIDAALAYD